jgi:DNA polymerase III subunit delta'
MLTWKEFSTSQPIVAKMLKNSIAKDRLAHAYLLHGSRGTGKKDASILLAKSFFCPNRKGSEACLQCRDCKRIDSGNHPDLHWIKPDGNSIKTEQISHLQKEFTYSGLESNKKVYIIEHADMMTTKAANQLLKFLEEPKRETLAILLTENLHAIWNTIRSRCQLMPFQPLNFKQFTNQLQELGLDETTAKLAAHLTNNLDEAVNLGQDEWFAKLRGLVIKLIESLHFHKEGAYLFLHSQWLPHFQDNKQMQLGLELLLTWYKDIVHYHLEYMEKLVFVNEKERLEKLALLLPQKFAALALRHILEAKSRLMANVNPTLVMEDLMIQLQG